jgi:hypothetical protein
MSNIITAQQVLDQTGAPRSLAQIVADAINQWIESSTGRVWGDEKTVTELYDASNVLWLRQMDITGVSSVKVGYPTQTRSTRPTDTYSWNKDGRLILSYARNTALPPSTSDYIEVTYKHGVPADQVPADLVLAALSVATSYYSFAFEQGGKDVVEEQIGSRRLKYAEGGGDGIGAAATSRDWQVIKAHAKRHL